MERRVLSGIREIKFSFTKVKIEIIHGECIACVTNLEANVPMRLLFSHSLHSSHPERETILHSFSTYIFSSNPTLLKPHLPAPFHKQ